MTSNLKHISMPFEGNEILLRAEDLREFLAQAHVTPSSQSYTPIPQCPSSESHGLGDKPRV